jgi:hypothetical protein
MNDPNIPLNRAYSDDHRKTLSLLNPPNCSLSMASLPIPVVLAPMQDRFDSMKIKRQINGKGEKENEGKMRTERARRSL